MKVSYNEHDCFNDNKENRRTRVQNQIESNKPNFKKAWNNMAIFK